MSSIYSNLDESKEEIRLITILPAEDDFDVVHCRLEKVSLADVSAKYESFLSRRDVLTLRPRTKVGEWVRSQDASDRAREDRFGDSLEPPSNYRRFRWGDYAALSYVWGDADKTYSIIVNGQEKQVTVNLAVALQELRARDIFRGPFKLWVDAISINQSDLVERGLQVRRMRDIYGTAWSVVAWLGSHYYESQKAVYLLHELAFFAKENRGQELEQRLRKDPGYLGMGGWLALHELMDQTYWYRLWILQEIIMGGSAVRLLVGPATIDWNSFRAAIALLEDNLWIVKDMLLKRDIDSQPLNKTPA